MNIMHHTYNIKTVRGGIIWDFSYIDQCNVRAVKLSMVPWTNM